MDINGYPLILMDTAGLRSKTSDLIEKEGMRRAMESIQNADLILFVIDVTKFLTKNNFQIFFEEYLKDLNLENLNLGTKKYVIILNKMDLVQKNNEFLNKLIEENKNIIKISCKTNYGFENLMDEMTQNIENM